MTTPMIKATYSLDEATVRALEETARRLGTSKSDVVRRAIRAAATGALELEPTPDPLAALDDLQSGLQMSRAGVEEWLEEARDLRRSLGRKATDGAADELA